MRGQSVYLGGRGAFRDICFMQYSYANIPGLDTAGERKNVEPELTDNWSGFVRLNSGYYMLGLAVLDARRCLLRLTLQFAEDFRDLGKDFVRVG